MRIMLLPIKCNAYVNLKAYKNNASKAVITLNLLPYLCNSFSSNLMCYFFMHVAVYHEIEHIKLFSELKNEETAYRRFVAGMEDINAKRRLIVSKLQPFIYRLNGIFKLNSKHYRPSISELICDYESVLVTKETFSNSLSCTELRTVNNILDSLLCAINGFEICYSAKGKPYNNFSQVISNAQRKIRKTPTILEKYHQLAYFFSSNGSLKPIDELTDAAMQSNSDMYSEILARFFIYFEFDWETFLNKNDDYKLYYESIANKYYDMCVSFLMDSKKCEVILGKEVIEDNKAMIIKNISRLNELMKKHGMKRYSEFVIPMYQVK